MKDWHPVTYQTIRGWKIEVDWDEIDGRLEPATITLTPPPGNPVESREFMAVFIDLTINEMRPLADQIAAEIKARES